MGLNYSYTKETDIPEALKSFYKKEGEEWVLDASGGMAEKVGEFRENNRRLFKEAADLKAQLKDIDLEGYKTYLEEKTKKIDDPPPVTPAKQADPNAEMLKQIKTLTTQIATIEKERDDARNKAMKQEFEGKIIAGAIAKNIRPEHHEDAILRAERVWKSDKEGNFFAMAGNDKMVGKDGLPISIEGWFDSIVDKAPGWFISSTGGGAAGNNGMMGRDARTLFNPTPEEFGKNMEAIAKGTITVNK